MDSILTSIKKVLGITEEYTHFDVDIIMHVNTTLSTLTQLGVGPPDGFIIEDAMSTWDEFLPNDKRLSSVKSYVYLKVKLLFDPPSSSAVMEAINKSIAELEWRILATIESDEKKEELQNGK